MHIADCHLAGGYTVPHSWLEDIVVGGEGSLNYMLVAQEEEAVGMYWVE